MFSRTLLFFGLAIFSLAGASALGAAAVTYHGRLVGPDGQAVEADGVTFKIQVRSPGAANCLLYEESRTVDMRNSQGIFVIPIGDGSSSRTTSDPGITIEDVFSNSPVNHTGLTCNSGHAYLPSTLDARKLVVTFNDGSGTGDQVLPPMDVNYVPFSLHAEEATRALNVGSTAASQIMSVASGAVTPLSAANFAELLLLVNGSSTAYLKPSSVPACASGQVLKGTGGAFVCVTDASGTDTLAGLSCADGKILKRMAGAWACADESGVGTESDPTVQPFAKNTVGAGLVVDGSDHVGVDFGTSAGKVARGDDSRFTDARAPNGAATGDLSGSYPNPSVKAIRGNQVSTTTPLNGQVYQWVNGSTEWQPKYVSFGDLKKSDGTPQMPASCAINQTLAWSAITDVFTCSDIGSLDASKITAGTLSASRLPADTMILSCADGKIAKRVAGAWACADDVGVGSEVDPSVAAYAKNAPATGLIVDGSNKIAPDFGTGAGKVVEGNDARLSDNRVASDINGVVSTGVVQRTGTGTFSTLGVAAPVTNSAGNLGLAVGSGLTLSGGSLVPDFGSAGGKVAQGNDSRFPSATCASGNYMRWTGSAWSCDADNATDSTKVLKSGDTMTGALNLPSNGLTVGASQLVVNGGNIGIGAASPTGALNLVRSGVDTKLILENYGTGVANTLAFLNGQGTAAVPSATQANDTLMQIYAGGYGTTAATVGSAAKIIAVAEEPFTDATGAASLRFHTRPPGTVGASSERMRIDQTGNVGIGTSAPSSTLQVAGSVATGFAAKSAAYTLTGADSVVTGNASGGAITLTLPTAVGITGRQYTLKKVDSSANAVTVATTSSQTIDGTATYSLAAQYNYVTVVSDGANWNVIGANSSSGGGSGVNVQTFDSSGTWTKPAGVTSVRVDCWGGGGGGGRQNGGYASAGGGGGGGYSFKDILASSLPATVSVTIGAGGVGVSSGGTGGQGGNSSFGSYLTAYGGAGGLSGGVWSAGGGGGGSMSAGSGATPGAPLISAGDGDGSTPTYQGGGGTSAAAVGALFHGGGGSTCYSGSGGPGGASSFGGGGGGGAGYACGAVAGGASGAAGAGGSSPAGAGSVPGGGGGAIYGAGTSGAGGSGRCIIKSF